MNPTYSYSSHIFEHVISFCKCDPVESKYCVLIRILHLILMDFQMDGELRGLPGDYEEKDVKCPTVGEIKVFIQVR